MAELAFQASFFLFSSSGSVPVELPPLLSLSLKIRSVFDSRVLHPADPLLLLLRVCVEILSSRVPEQSTTPENRLCDGSDAAPAVREHVGDC